MVEIGRDSTIKQQRGSGAAAASAARGRRRQRGGGVAGNETEARWWRQLSFS